MISLDTPPSHEIAHEPLVAALRHEVEEYGALMVLFEEQQTAILGRQADRVAELAEALERQAQSARTRRKEREAMVVQLTPVGSDSTKQATITDLLPLMREAVRPLVEALKDEINRMLTQTRRRAQQNQMLLARTIENGQDLLRRLNPEAASSTYSPQGRMKGRSAPRASRLLSHS